MKSSAKPRRKKEPEPLDWRALASAPALRGLNEVLAATPTVGDTQESRGRHLLPTVGVPPTVSEAATQKRVAVLPTVGGSPTVGETWVDRHGHSYDATRIKRAASPDDGMTLGEERLYAVMRRAGQPSGSGDAVEIVLGYDRLAHLTRLNEKSVRLAMRGLIAKKIVEIAAAEDSASRRGRRYRVFGEAAILERQRAAGLEYIARNGRGVEFVALSPTVGVPPTVGKSVSAAR